ncbi:EboA domain-containing protein [Streptomyces sp. ISL-100]|uniref:EboA domain-containing protein n=1 Tax=Streptomyces sp. ISL-100 TaxID=2819173 RepID=UPI001BE501C8|nr:EboA domain-containing protein [Streptomyces sp. ISL-100]MBT2397191.1 EboA domain-containing protein [Streptomyces sp. ISL-100]
MLTELTNGAPLSALQAALEEQLTGAARAWLHEALAEAEAEAKAKAAKANAKGHFAEPADRPRWTLPTWELRFAEAGRHCRPVQGTESTPDLHSAQDLADAARVLLLHAVRADHATITRLYTHGTAAERRAVLLALPHFNAPSAGPATLLPLVEDALRTNDTRLVAAAVGPYAAEHLDQHAWRHAVLKCLFTGVPVDAIDGLAPRARADSELARMLRDYAAERTAAGRPVPDDLHRVLALTARPYLTAAPTEES